MPRKRSLIPYRTDDPEQLGTRLAYLIPCALFASLLVVPSAWSDAARSGIWFQYFTFEFMLGVSMMAEASWIREHHRYGWRLLGLGLLMLALVGGVVLTALSTQDLGVTLMLASVAVPRALECRQALTRGRRYVGLILRQGVFATGGVVVIGVLWIALMQAGPEDAPNSYSTSPPVSIMAILVAAHYLLLAYVAGLKLGRIERWVGPDDPALS